MKEALLLLIIPLLLVPTLAHAEMWTFYNETSRESGPINMTVANSQHIEFYDIHGGTIHLMKGGGDMQMGAGVINTPYSSGYQHIRR